MKEKTKEKQQNKLAAFTVKGMDISIIFVSFFLSIFCLVFVYSALAFEASGSVTFLHFITMKGSDRTILKTLLYIVLGIGLMILFASVNIEYWKKKAPAIMAFFLNPLPYYLLSIGFFVFIEIMKHVGNDVGGESEKSALVGGGWLIKANGAYRWIRIPLPGGASVNFQPSEVVKLLLIICFALIIYNAGMSLTRYRGILLYLFLIAIPAFCVFEFSSDLSSSIVLFGILFVMMFIGGPDWKKSLTTFGVIMLAGLLAFGLLLFINKGKEEADIKPYQAKRILAWIYPEDYPASADQTNQALYAIGSGGYFGEGIGNSMQKMKKLPEAQNDMIFALICEELGLVGGFAVLALYLVMIFRMYMIAQNTDNLLDRLIVVGVITHVALQVIINVFVVTRLFPNTGIPLPLISSGGSSILFMYAEIGLVLNIGKSIERR